MSGANGLLDATQLAAFVANGYLRFDSLLSRDLCTRVIDEYDRGALRNVWPDFTNVPDRFLPGQPFDGFFADSSLGEVFDMAEVRGVIESLLGPNSIYDHHYFHVTHPGSRSQVLHYDAIIDFRLDFDIQLFFFLQDTPREMGGTLMVPGTHLRPVHDLGRIQNVRGQMHVECDAGTMIACHQGIWHAGQPNRSSRNRYMFKLRLNPSTLQSRRFDVSTLDAPGAADEIKSILTKSHAWEGADHNHEVVRRTRLWRLLSGDETYDTESWLRRTTCAPSGRRL